ncbi:MAG: adenylate kinase [Ruminococcaceae bacterium]|nr:adenylate kinase [Oscillospiraceae bacterium]
MKKVIIIGCPGSGKSTFGRMLKNKTGLPLYHLDMLYWNEDRTTVEKSVFLDRLKNVMKTDEWIIDGNYASTMEMRFAECDTVFFLDYPTEVCIEGVKSRVGKPRSDIPWIETDAIDDEFLSFIQNYNTVNRPKVVELIEKYSDKNVIVFKSRKEADEYIGE